MHSSSASPKDTDRWRKSCVKSPEHSVAPSPNRSITTSRLIPSFRAGVYTMQEIADHFRVPYATVSRAVRWLEASEGEIRDCKT
jgi:hypothetical protein